MLLEDEEFVGIEIDERKLARLNRMRDACREICELEPSFTSPYQPFDNRTRNAIVVIRMEDINIFGPEVSSRIAMLMNASDTTGVSMREEGGIQMTFGVRNMWKKYETNDDMDY